MIPDRRVQAQATVALLTVLRAEGLTEAVAYHEQLWLIAHAGAVCAVALGVERSLLRELFFARYGTLARSWPGVVAPIAPGARVAFTTAELVRITGKLCDRLDAVTRKPWDQVWLLLHVLAGNGVHHGAPSALLWEMLDERYQAALDSIEKEAKKGGKA